MRVKTLLLCSVFLLIFSSLSAMTPPRPAVKKIPADEFEYTDGLAWTGAMRNGFWGHLPCSTGLRQHTKGGSATSLGFTLSPKNSFQLFSG